MLKTLSYLFILFFYSCNLLPKVTDADSTQDELDCQEIMPSKIIKGRIVNINESISKESVLLLIQRENKTSLCTGVPVSGRVILTAAHCVKNAIPTAINVIFHTDMNCESGYSREKSISSVNFVIHKDFDGSPQSKSDLALIKLSSSIPKDYPIATFYDGKTKPSTDKVELSGYGITGEVQRDAKFLRTTEKSFRKDVYIKSPLVLLNQSNSTGGFCRGDSGAPVYVDIAGTKKILAINSFNIGNVTNKECHTASAGMYIPYFSDWIKNEIINF